MQRKTDSELVRKTLEGQSIVLSIQLRIEDISSPFTKWILSLPLPVLATLGRTSGKIDVAKLRRELRRKYDNSIEAWLRSYISEYPEEVKNPLYILTSYLTYCYPENLD